MNFEVMNIRYHKVTSMTKCGTENIRNICFVKSVFQILYAVEEFSSHFQGNFWSFKQIKFKIFYPNTLPVYAVKKNNYTAKFMVSLKQNKLEGFIDAP